MSARVRDERGSVTVVAAAVTALVAVLTMGAADVGKALVARERAQAAADAAALAAAQELVMPTGRAPTELAAEYAARNGADADELRVPGRLVGGDRRGPRRGRSSAPGPGRP